MINNHNNYIYNDKAEDFSKSFVKEALYNMYVEDARAVTCSNTSNKVSIVIFNQHKSKADYLKIQSHGNSTSELNVIE